MASSDDYLSPTEWCPLDRGLVLYGRHLSQVLQFCAFVHGLLSTAFGHVECQHNSKLRDVFVNEMCAYGPARFVIQEPFNGDQQQNNNETSVFDEGRNFSYYPWVSFMLFGQSLACKLVWNLFERSNRHRLHQLAKLNRMLRWPHAPVWPERSAIQHCKFLDRLVALVELVSDDTTPYYPIQYGAVLLGSLLSIAGQMALLQWLFNGPYLTLGIRLAMPTPSQLPEHGHDRWLATVTELFPHVISCRLATIYGPSGSPHQISTLCSLNHNIINGYIFTTIWWLFLALATAIMGALVRLTVIRLFVGLLPRYRFQREQLRAAFQMTLPHRPKNQADGMQLLLLLIGSHPNHLTKSLNEWALTPPRY